MRILAPPHPPAIRWSTRPNGRAASARRALKAAGARQRANVTRRRNLRLPPIVSRLRSNVLMVPSPFCGDRPVYFSHSMSPPGHSDCVNQQNSCHHSHQPPVPPPGTLKLLVSKSCRLLPPRVSQMLPIVNQYDASKASRLSGFPKFAHRSQTCIRAALRPASTTSSSATTRQFLRGHRAAGVCIILYCAVWAVRRSRDGRPRGRASALSQSEIYTITMSPSCRGPLSNAKSSQQSIRSVAYARQLEYH